MYIIYIIIINLLLTHLCFILTFLFYIFLNVYYETKLGSYEFNNKY